MFWKSPVASSGREKNIYKHLNYQKAKGFFVKIDLLPSFTPALSAAKFIIQNHTTILKNTLWLCSNPKATMINSPINLFTLLGGIK